MDTLDVNARLTGAQAARYAQVTRQAVHNWHERGYLTRDGERVYLTQGDDGKYRLLDVAKAEHATRRRARRT